MTEICPMPENKKRGGGEEAGGERKRRKTRSRGRGGVRKEWVPEGARGTRERKETEAKTKHTFYSGTRGIVEAWVDYDYSEAQGMTILNNNEIAKP